MKRTGIILIAAMLVWCAAATPASASFHLMQIEQVIGGVNGDTSAQAIQLRMRSAFQNQLQLARIRVVDATGANSITIVDMGSSVANSSAGSRVLIASAGFADYSDPAVVPDFVMTSLIPQSYMAAGSLIFESDTGVIYWRLSWGGASYTGPQTGNTANDSNGNFGPAFGAALPSSNLSAIRFNGSSGALSTTNAADYSVSGGAATFTNNANVSFDVVPAVCGGTPGDLDEDTCLTGLDLQPFTDCIVNGPAGTTPCACADIDSDATLDMNDVDLFVDDLLAAPECP